MSSATEQAPKVTLYWLEQSRSQRIVWLLEECKIPYEIELFKRFNNRADPALKKIHPLGKSPVVSIEAPGAKSTVLAESGLITEYFTEHYAPHLAPKRYVDGKEGPGLETESWFRYRYFMHYAEGSLMPPMVIRLVFGILKGPMTPFYVRPITRAIANNVDAMFLDGEFAANFSFLESQLATSPDNGEYLCGKDLTSADILMSFPLSAARQGGYIDEQKYPKLWAYILRLENNPVHKQSIEKVEKLTGEPYKVSGRG